MTHPTEEDMVDGFYSGISASLESHLETCRECATLYQRIRETLETASEAELPQRGSGYGAEVWARLSVQLPVKPQPWRFKAWFLLPAAAAILVLLFALRPQPPQLPVIKVARITVPPPTLVASEPQRPTTVRHISAVHLAVKHQSPLSESAQDARLLALSGLLETDTGQALPQLLQVINSDSSDRIREHALFVLAQSDSAEAHRSLLDFARQSSNLSLQTKAVRMLGLMADKNEPKELVGLYRNSSDQALKREILNGLMFSGSKTTLLTVAKTESNPMLRDSAMADLSITVTPVQGSVFSLKTDHAEKKQILNSVFLSADAGVLLNVLRKQPNAGLRVATIRSLAVMGEQGKVLTDLYRTDHDDQVRRAVLDALVVQQNGDALSDLARDETDLLMKTEILTRLATIRAQADFK